MARDLKLALKLKAAVDGLDKVRSLVGEIEDMGGAADNAKGDAAALANELGELARQQKLIDQFRDLKKEVSGSEKALKASKQETARLAKAMKAAGTPSKALTKQFEASRKTSKRLAAEYQGQQLKLQGLRGSMDKAGLSSNKLSAAQVRIRKEVTQTQTRVQGLTTNLQVLRSKTAQGLKDPTKNMRRGVAQTSQETDKLSGALGNARSQILGLIGVAGVGGLAAGVISATDKYKKYTAQLKLATDTTEEQAQAEAELFRISQDTRSQLESSITLYSRLARSRRELGVEQQQILDLTELTAQAFKISGATQAESAATVTQFSQALGSGVLRGEEFNSIMENGGRLARALADGLGVTIGQLRAMANAGELSAKRVTEALLKQKDIIAKEYAELPATVEGSVTKLVNAYQRWIGTQEEAQQGSALLAETISDLAANIDEVAQVAIVAGKVMVAVWAVKAVKALGAAALEAAKAGAAVKSIPTSVQVAIAVIGFELLERAAKAGAELAASMTGVDDAAKQASETSRRWIESQIDGVDKLLPKLEQYASVQQLSAEQVSRLGDTERQRYKDSLGGLAKYLKALQSRGTFETALLQNQIEAGRAAGATEQGLAALTARYEEANSALATNKARLDAVRQAQTDMQTAATAAAAQVSAGAVQLVQQFEALRAKGDEVNKVLATLGEGADLGTPVGIRAWTEGLRLLQEQGQITADQLTQTLGAALQKLSAEDLQLFQVTAAAAFDGSVQGAADLTTALNGSLTEALQRLGVDVQEVRTGISATAGDAITLFQTVSDNALRSGDEIAAAFDAAFSQTKNIAELNALQLALQSASDAGIIGVEAVDDRMARLQRRTLELSAQLEGRLADAFARFGIQSRGELQATAKAAEQDFALVLSSGEATSDGLIKAAKAYLAAQRAAYGEIIPATEELTAAQRILADAARKAGDAGAEAGQRIAVGMRDAASAATTAADAVQSVAEANKAAANAARGGFSGSGGTVNTGQSDRVAATGDAQAIAEFNKFLDSGKTFVSLAAQLDATNAAADKAIAGAERRKAAAQGTNTGSTGSTSSTAAAALPSAGNAGVVVVRMGDVAPQVSDADLADRVTRQLGFLGRTSNQT